MAAVLANFPSGTHTRKTASNSAPPGGKERYAAGKALRQKVERELHGKWTSPPNRRNPVDLVLQSSKGRIPELVPIRYGRMMISPFTFYRGTANIMAEDLAATPVSGLQAQLCGDAHLLNFGGFATPERRLVLDINDFDETFPGPWEWDLKRLATSFVFAARSNGFSAADQREAALTCVRSYREHMLEYADMTVLEIWYASLDLSDTLATIHRKEAKHKVEKQVEKVQLRQATEHQFPKLVEARSGHYVIKDEPPLIYHHPHIVASGEALDRALAQYRQSLSDARRVLLDRYKVMDFALKVVGVGSVGTFLRKVEQAIDENLDNAQFDVDWLARSVAMGRSSLYRQMKTIRNVSPRKFILERRLQHAALLFANRRKTITEVAFTVGFKSLSHFSRSFHSYYGVTPAAYLKRIEHNDSSADI
jgi:AraC-like DNA-binding protein